MIISSFWANEPVYILKVLINYAAFIVIGIFLVIIGCLQYITSCLDQAQLTNKRCFKYVLYGMAILIPLGIIIFSIYGFQWAVENYTPPWMLSVKPKYYPPDAFCAGCLAVSIIAIVSILIRLLVSFIATKLAKRRIRNKELKENPFLILDDKGIGSRLVR